MSAVIQTYRDTPEAQRGVWLGELLEASSTIVAELLSWAAEAEGVEPGDFWLFSDLADLVDSRESAGMLKLAEAELRWMEGDSTQSVLEVAIEAVGFNGDLSRAYEVTYELLYNHDDLVWEDAMERLDPDETPADAIALLAHMIARAEAARNDGPPFLGLAPTAGDPKALAANGQIAEAINARMHAGAPFPAARAAVLSS